MSTPGRHRGKRKTSADLWNAAARLMWCGYWFWLARTMAQDAQTSYNPTMYRWGQGFCWFASMFMLVAAGIYAQSWLNKRGERREQAKSTKG